MPKESQIHSVLLIEDNPADASLVKRYLSANELIKTSLIHCKDISSALEELIVNDYAVILLDLSLPDSFGLDTLHILRQKIPNRTLNIIVLTGNSDKKIGIEAIKAGAQDFLIKGNIDSDSLGKSIRFAIERIQTYKFLDETQRSARLGSWKYIPDTDGFEISPIVFELFQQDIFYGTTLEDAILKTSGKFQLFQDFIRKYNDYYSGQDDISIHIHDKQIFLLIKFEKIISIDNRLELIGTVQDISERVHAEQLTKEAEFNKRALELKEHFIATVSHEMRTPMNVILGLSRLMLDTPLDEIQFNYIQSIIHSGELLTGIVNDILELSSHQKGKLELKNESVDFNKLMRQVQKLMLENTKEKNLSFEVEISSMIPQYLNLDPLRIQQILVNLINNAIKFTDNGGIKVMIDFKEKSKKSFLNITIEDTGIGIPPETIGSIFEPFVRLHNKNKFYEGTGLGLTIVKSWLDKMNGIIKVKSTLLKGTIIELTIPVSRQKEKIDNNEIHLVLGNHVTSPKKIMIVDDHALNRLVAQKSIEQKFKNCIITIAENGKEALSKLDVELPDIILMDLQMPVMDGYEATWIIKKSKNDKIAAIPILAMTANAFVTKDTELRTKGFADFILKPFDLDDLVFKINHYTTL